MTRIGFLSTMEGAPWGGSEELWCQTASRLLQRGVSVAASVRWWPEMPARIGELRAAGCEVDSRRPASRARRVAARFGLRESDWLDRAHPQLVVISQGAHIDGVGWALKCARRGIPYALIAQCAHDFAWPDDGYAAAAREAYDGAVASFFVSHGNIRLLEAQLGAAVPNARVVRNPFNVAYSASVPWPRADSFGLACVARLEPRAKGQDVLFATLSAAKWRERPLDVTLFGNGPNASTLRALKERYCLERVTFGGFASSIERVWAEHHALILPSRFEGLPLSLVEAMLCARPAIVTDVAGNAELVDDGVNGFVAAAPAAACLDDALERAWRRRADWEEMGKLAALKVRQEVPPDPIGIFADELLGLCS